MIYSMIDKKYTSQMVKNVQFWIKIIFLRHQFSKYESPLQIPTAVHDPFNHRVMPIYKQLGCCHKHFNETFKSPT